MSYEVFIFPEHRTSKQGGSERRGEKKREIIFGTNPVLYPRSHLLQGFCDDLPSLPWQPLSVRQQAIAEKHSVRVYTHTMLAKSNLLFLLVFPPLLKEQQ